MRLAALFVLCLLLTGCVTEKRATRGAPLRPGQSSSQSPAAPTPRTVSAGAQPPVLTGPIATPATTATISASRVLVQVASLGAVTYDTQTLPIVSPDGRFIAVQEGEAPLWPALLGEPGAEPPSKTFISIYDISTTPARRITPAEPLPRAIMLGRSADNTGFLVEQVRPDGARWIGKADWGTGRIVWLAQGDNQINASGVLTRRGELAFTRRTSAPGGPPGGDLVLRARSGAEHTLAPGAGSFLFPMTTADLDVVYVLSVAPDTGVKLLAIRLDRGGNIDGPPRPTTVIARRQVSTAPEALLAYQMALTAPPASIRDLSEAEQTHEPLVIFDPRQRRMAEFALDTGVLEPLAPDSVAAIRLIDPHRRGYFCTTPEGLVFQPAPRDRARPSESAAAASTARVIAGPYVPRQTGGSPQTVLLVGPIKSRPDRLELLRMAVGAPETPPKAP